MSEASKITVIELIATLPDEERAIVLLHYGQNLSTDDIAQKLSVPERAVDAVLRQARLRLHRALNFSPISPQPHSEE